MPPLVLAMFVFVLVLVLGIYWALLGREESSEQRTLKRRLRTTPASRRSAAPVLVRREERLSAVPVLDAMLGGVERLTLPLQRTLKQANLPITVGTLILASGCLALLVGLGVARLTALPWLSAGTGVLALFLPHAYVRSRARRRLQQFEEQLPEAIDLISRALRAGHAFTTGLAMVADEAPQPLASEFRLLYDRQNFGMPLPEAMRRFAERVSLLDARFLATAVLTQREAGGNLSEVLDNLARVMRERFRVKRQVRVITAHGRMTGWVLTAMPPVLAALFMVTNPNHIRAMLNDPLGVQMIVVAVSLQIIGTLIIRKLVNIEY
jgi:tight adherence protein B